MQQKLLELLECNPFPHDEPKLEDSKSSPPDRPVYKTEAFPSGIAYCYCMVQVHNIKRPFAYLTGGLPAKVGDWVEVPFGNDNRPQRGQVVSLQEHTRASAPWPPERTKTILRIIPAENKEAATQQSTE